MLNQPNSWNVNTRLIRITTLRQVRESVNHVFSFINHTHAYVSYVWYLYCLMRSMKKIWTNEWCECRNKEKKQKRMNFRLRLYGIWMSWKSSTFLNELNKIDHLRMFLKCWAVTVLIVYFIGYFEYLIFNKSSIELQIRGWSFSLNEVICQNIYFYLFLLFF